MLGANSANATSYYERFSSAYSALCWAGSIEDGASTLFVVTVCRNYLITAMYFML
ncbi:hypothetical protein PILCRDRAFT_191613 [Piloderma croceum F 1598]|uniref:Uncharacterized protein n=1 Tax=Piloderma croceum (strain F 1598) TaxID=765440 RepID=A0A0C3BSY2_PILCF|nr:hypothetical protein PILCRDRAFT_191613 [Piloderma croceum F 1598]